jgi:hypothetical protein
VDWIGLAQDRNRWRVLVNSVLNLQVPQNARKLSNVLTALIVVSEIGERFVIGLSAVPVLNEYPFCRLSLVPSA